MAVTAIWDIKGRFDRVIDYAVNPQKTVTESAKGMASLHAIDDIIQYTTNEMKTEECRFVTGQNVDPEAAKEQFKETKMMHKKVGGILAFHAYQSFAPGEVDADTAHKIGVKLAKKLWDDYEVIIATHCNTGCFHNHFVINSVSIKTGKKYNDCKETYQLMREESDRLCKEYGLSVIENPKDKGMNYAEWKAQQDDVPTLRGGIRNAIDMAVKMSVTKKQFLEIMDEMGFVIDESGKYPKIKHVGNERFVRFKSLGEGYSVEEIIERIYSKDRVKTIRFPEQEDPRQIFEGEEEPVAIMTYVPLFRSYLKALNIAKERPTTNFRIYYLVRQDTSVIRLYTDTFNLVVKHNLKTTSEVIAYKENAMRQIDEKMRLRNEMRNLLKRAERAGDKSTANKARFNINLYSRELSGLRREVTTCDEVLAINGHVRENLTRIEQNKFRGKEKVSNEPSIRRSRSGREDDIKRD